MSKNVKDNACNHKYLPFEYYNCHNVENTTFGKLTVLPVYTTVAAISTITPLIYLSKAIAAGDVAAIGLDIALLAPGAMISSVFLDTNTREAAIDSIHFLAENSIEIIGNCLLSPSV